MIIVAVSGYFDPPTPPHVGYFEAARKLGDKLVVILNTDEQLLNKRRGTPLEGRIRYPFEDRKAIISAFRCVDEVVASIDTDESVAMTLRMIRPNIFAKGGDRTPGNLNAKEIQACQDIGCQVVTGVGPPKTHSSSWYNWED